MQIKNNHFTIPQSLRDSPLCTRGPLICCSCTTAPFTGGSLLTWVLAARQLPLLGEPSSNYLAPLVQRGVVFAQQNRGDCIHQLSICRLCKMTAGFIKFGITQWSLWNTCSTVIFTLPAKSAKNFTKSLAKQRILWYNKMRYQYR